MDFDLFNGRLRRLLKDPAGSWAIFVISDRVVSGADGYDTADDGVNGYLILKDGHSLLIDCPVTGLAGLLPRGGFPLPERILHTRTVRELCREGDTFPAEIWVGADSLELAGCTAAYRQDCDTRWGEDYAWEERGQERYGLAGCVTQRPPEPPLRGCWGFLPGQRLEWRGVSLTVLPLPGVGKYACGFWWEE